MSRQHQHSRFIGRLNCIPVLGMTWPQTRRSAAALGIPEIRPPREDGTPSERVILFAADALVAALEAQREQQPEPDNARAELARRLGAA